MEGASAAQREKARSHPLIPAQRAAFGLGEWIMHGHFLAGVSFRLRRQLRVGDAQRPGDEVHRVRLRHRVTRLQKLHRHAAEPR